MVAHIRRQCGVSRVNPMRVPAEVLTLPPLPDLGKGS